MALLPALPLGAPARATSPTCAAPTRSWAPPVEARGLPAVACPERHGDLRAGYGRRVGTVFFSPGRPRAVAPTSASITGHHDRHRRAGLRRTPWTAR
ncbi:MAG: hypothetical protein ACLTDR_01055 [Adlercreutzia equolifaciens]